MRALTRRWGLALATGAVFVVFSEAMFWPSPAKLANPGAIGAWIAYSLLAWVFLALRNRFRARSVWAIFLCGAAVGWLAEGVIVRTVYEQLPLSLSWTGLAWHALITVVGGWWLLGGAVVGGDTARTARFATVIGLCWGVWVIFWWVEDGKATPVATFALSALGAGVALAAGLAGTAALGGAPFTPSRGESWAVGGLVGIAYALTVVTTPLALLLVPLLAVVYLALRANRKREDGEPCAAPAKPRLRPATLAALLPLPVAAIAVYGAADLLGLRLPTNWVVYLVTTPTGAAMFVLAATKLLRRTLVAPEVEQPRVA